MNQAEKAFAYDALLQDVKSCSRCHGLRGTVKLHGCDFCEEINLWSYWEGGRDRLDAKVLLVGQDWGDCYSDDHIRPFIDAQKSGTSSVHYMDNNLSITNRNLAALFESIGYDILRDENGTRNSKELFFTNFVLCYRSNGLTGGFQDAWVRNCSDYFRRLVSIIGPKVILCLGRKVYEGVMKSLEGREAMPGWRTYNERLDTHVPSVAADRNCAVFPLAHCGIMGTNTRNRGKSFTDILDIQKQDWQEITRYL
jgi:uracil-DNA glycosylase